MKNTHTCICLNLPGFGGTPPGAEPSIYFFANWINEQIKKLNITNYTLCGHSMSAKLILYAAQMMTGEPPKKLILVAPSPPTTENMSKEDRLRMLDHPNIEEARNTVDKVIRKRMRKAKRQYAIDSQLRIDNNTWQWWLNQGMHHDISKFIEFLQIPVFVICSRKDPVIKMKAIYNEVLPNLNRASLIIFNRCGHLIPMESPRKLAREIRRISRLKYKTKKGAQAVLNPPT